MKLLSIIFITAVTSTCGFEPKSNPVEVGSVHWGRNIDTALTESAETGKPIFLFFQEVPGCAGCQRFGRTVMTNPLLIEAIEDEFLPVLVYNNRSQGMDKEILDRYKEPAWNFQVVRFVNSKGHDIIPRKDQVWTLGGIASRMTEALKAANRPIPKYLEAVALENDQKRHSASAFAMPCFWTGKVALGKVDGVLTTEAGWIEGLEVTKVVYDKNAITLPALTKKARDAQCALKVFAPESKAKALKGITIGKLDSGYRKARPSDQKKQIENWKTIEKLPGLTEMQKTKINAFIHSDRSKALEWLSPKQLQALGLSNQ